jgi:uncharacterized protein
MNNTPFRAKLTSVAAFLLLFVAVSAAFGQDSTPWNQNVSPLPSPTGPVNDYAGVFDETTKQQLNKRLIDYQRSSGVELAVAVVKTTGDRPIFEYSLAVYRGWGIGSKDGDNPGALLLVAIDDRKYFTQVSRDLEDELPDGVAGNLQRQYLVPEFRKGNYAKGISDTIEAYITTIEQRSSGTAASPTPVGGSEPEISGSQALYSTFCCLVIIGVILLIIWSNRGGGKSGKDRDRWGGGGFGGGAASALPWIIGSVIGGSGSSSSSDWGSSSGGFGGGGSDWGGFGGGGDAGGGGAGGDW